MLHGHYIPCLRGALPDTLDFRSPADTAATVFMDICGPGDHANTLPEKALHTRSHLRSTIQVGDKSVSKVERGIKLGLLSPKRFYLPSGTSGQRVS